MDNGYGRGWMCSGTVFVISETCPLHGKEATEKLKRLREETE